MKKAGEKGWTDFQAFWSGPQEEGVEMNEDTENHQPSEGTGGREEEVGDLLGSFSDEPAAAQSSTGGPTSNKRSYASTSYGSTGDTNTQASHQSKSRPPGGWFCMSLFPLFLPPQIPILRAGTTHPGDPVEDGSLMAESGGIWVDGVKQLPRQSRLTLP